MTWNFNPCFQEDTPSGGIRFLRSVGFLGVLEVAVSQRKKMMEKPAVSSIDFGYGTGYT